MQSYWILRIRSCKERVIACKAKLEILDGNLSKHNFYRFSLLAALSSAVTEDDISEFVGNKTEIHEVFESRFGDIETIRSDLNLFVNRWLAQVKTKKNDTYIKWNCLVAKWPRPHEIKEWNAWGISENVKSIYSRLHNFSMKMATMFRTICICDWSFSDIKIIESKFRSEVNGEDLESIIGLSTSSFDLDMYNFAIIINQMWFHI